MKDYAFIHLPSRKNEERDAEERRFGDLLWLAKFKKGKYSFSREEVKKSMEIDLKNLSGASRLFLASLPVWYAHLSPIIEKSGHSYDLVDLIDSDIKYGQDNSSEYRRCIPASSNYLLSPVNNNTPLAFEVIGFLKKHRRESRIIVGGAQASYEDLEFLKRGADLVVRGEGEVTFKDIVNGQPLEKIKGISFLRKGVHVRNPNQQPISSLDDLPFYDWSQQPQEYNPSFYIRFFSQRGCPMNCCFCSDVLWANRSVRRKSLERLRKELDSITQNARFLEFHIGDNCFSSNRDFAMGFAELLSGYRLNWTAETRVDMVDEKLLYHLHKNGCVELEFGVESANDNVLRLSDKRQDRKKIVRAFELTKNAGINVHTNWMIGLPGETKDSFLANVDFACDMTAEGLIDTMNHVIMVPYPGTPLEKNPAKYGIKILTRDWTRYDEYGMPVFESESMSRQDMLSLYHYANKRFADVLERTHNSML